MTGTSASGPAQNQLNKLYAAGALNTVLRYGEQYEFRIRLQDLSGGGPALDPAINPINELPANTVRARFKRYVAPNQPRIEDLPVNTDLLATDAQLQLQRPLLGYPAVIYTGKYADPITRLNNASLAMLGKEAFGIADPDVNRVEVTVEVQSLRMDNLLSASGTESYVLLYTTFPFLSGGLIHEDDYEAVLNIPIIYPRLSRAACRRRAGPDKRPEPAGRHR